MPRLALCLILLAPLSFAAEKAAVSVSDYPYAVVESQEFTFTVNYDIAAELGEVPLHVEFKNPKHVVMVSQIANVSGKGSKAFTFLAPANEAEPVVFFALWFGQVWTQAIGQIVQTDEIRVMSPEDATKLAGEETFAKEWRERMAPQLADGPAFGVLVDDLPGLDRAVSDKLLERLRAQGLTCVTLTLQEACNRHILTPDNLHTLLLTNSETYPVEGIRAIEQFLTRGGDIIALNAPAFRKAVRLYNGQWMTEPQVREMLAGQKADRVLFDFETGDAGDWTHTSGDKDPVTYEFAAGGADGTARALHCDITKYQTWNTFVAPVVEKPFAEDQELTCFWAKGAPDTKVLAVEWSELDGSRWIATTPITTEWKYIVLSPWDFKYWQDSASKGRGGANDQFKPQNAEQLTVGLAMTHTFLPSGPQQFWVDQIGVAANRFGDLSAPDSFQIPPIEMLCPTYKFHEVSNAASLKVSDKQCLLKAATLPVPVGLMSAQPRPQGTGFNKNRRWRWVPLLEAFDASGEVCGTPATLTINGLAPRAQSQVASFALPPASYEDPAVLDMVAALAKRMHDGVYLFEGGAEFYAYFEGEAVKLGAHTINLSGKPEAELSARFFVTSKVGTEFEQAVPVKDGVAECTWAPGQFAGDTYEARCVLVDADGKMLDSLAHPLLVWRPAAQPDFMQVKDGHFTLGGKPWRAHGVNYMPSSGIGIEDGEYFEQWMGSRAYDPVVIERDLSRVKAMGMNAVSIFCYYQSLGSRNLLDILERCRRHGLMVNLSLRPGTPLDFRWEEMKALIEAFRLKENDTVFAYDLAWEPMFGNHSMAKRWDGEWEKWIVNRYGSVANAEADWGVPVPREDGKVTVPSDQQMEEAGQYRVMVCAYRRFLDDLLAKKHALANGLVKSIDPNHFTSFRMAEAGNPLVGPSWIAYDFRGLARSVDIMEPEGYGRIGDWEKVKPGRFVADYARCMAPGRPVMWAEFGCSTWDMPSMSRDAERDEWVGGYYGRFYRMVQDSQADGTMCWWYPGGFRTGENSDYGVTREDGADRPQTKVIREWADRMKAPVSGAPVDQWITIDRDLAGKGVFGVYQAVQERYWKIVEDGRNPGLRLEGMQFDSTSAPAVAVGNVRYKPGKNPHKYLNAEFDRLEVLNIHGVWQPIEDGAVVRIRRGDAVLVRATIGNNGEAKWLALPPAGQQEDPFAGQVMISAGEANCYLRADVPAMGTAIVEDFQVCELQETMEVDIQMTAWPGVSFGERVRVRFEAE